MKNVTVINPNDVQYFAGWEVSLYNYDNHVYIVYAPCEQDALDTLVNELVERDELGHVYTPMEMQDWENEKDFILAGDSYYLDTEHTHIKAIERE